jgi:ribosomal protein L11 methyltransferase
MRLNSKNPAIEAPKGIDAQTLRADIAAMITSATVKPTPAGLHKMLTAKYGLEKKQIKTLLKELIFSGDIAYAYQYGRTVLEPSFHQPVRISSRVLLAPPAVRCSPQAGDVIVRMYTGAAFGCGRHPTTRLAVRGIEHVQTLRPSADGGGCAQVLDVGTGSGVLVITAMLMGMESGLGIDIDPCARAEAHENLKINGLEERVEIADLSLDAIGRQFGLVTANLRLPSLLQWRPKLVNLTAPGGLLVLSGIRGHECEALLGEYAADCRCRWQAEELNWAAVVLQRRQSSC